MYIDEKLIKILEPHIGETIDVSYAISLIKTIAKEHETEQCDIPIVSGMLKHRSGVKGVFIKSFYPTGKPLTTVIETNKGYYCAPSNEFVDEQLPITVCRYDLFAY